MDSQKFLNIYITSLVEQVKKLTMEKIMLETQLALTKEEIEELKTQVPQPAPPEPNNSTWQ